MTDGHRERENDRVEDSLLEQLAFPLASTTARRGERT